MKLEIIAVGKIRDPNLRSIADDYQGRIRHYVPIEEIEIREARVSGHDLAAALQEEGRALEKAAPAGGVRVALNEDGRQLTSAQFAGWMENWMLGGTRHVSFCIGSAHGLDPQFKQECDHILSLSPMTYPHEFARVMLAEQIYRALTIIRGEPYHK